MFKSYYGIDIQNSVTGTGIKERIPVAGIALVNYNLSSNLVGTIIDGVTLAVGMRFLFAGQTIQTQNGIYIINTTSTRAPDLNTGMVATNIYVFVQSSNTIWQVIGTCVVGTNNMIFKMTTNVGYVSGDIFYCDSSSIKILNAPLQKSFLSMDNSGIPSWINKTETYNNIMITADSILVSSTTYKVIGYFPYITSLYGSSKNITLVFEVAGSGNMNIKVTGSVVLYTSPNLTAGFYQLSFTGPSSTSRMTFEVKKNSGTNVNIYGINLIF